MTKSPLENLAAAPQKFRFDAAFRLLTGGRPGAEDDDGVKFVASGLLSQPVSEVTRVDVAEGKDGPRMSSPLIGLIGPSGVMPRWYTELVAQSVRLRATAISDFLICWRNAWSPLSPAPASNTGCTARPRRRLCRTRMRRSAPGFWR